jgi:hypothetical protein
VHIDRPFDGAARWRVCKCVQRPGLDRRDVGKGGASAVGLLDHAGPQHLGVIPHLGVCLCGNCAGG